MAGQSDFLSSPSSPVKRQSLATYIAGAVRPLVAPARCQSGESLAGGLKDRFASRLGLIAPDNHVDIERINLDPTAAPPRPFGGDERRSRPKEGIDHDITARRDIEKRVRQQGRRLHGRVVSESLAHPNRSRRRRDKPKGWSANVLCGRGRYC